MLTFPGPQALKTIAGGYGHPDILAAIAADLPGACHEYGIDTGVALAFFLGQCVVESDSFETTVEYASGEAYEGRRDLGNVYPGDGPKFKGMGIIQVTGRDNSEECARALGCYDAWLADPKILSQFPYALESAAWFWRSRGLTAMANRYVGTPESLRAVAYAITGRVNGSARLKLAERTNATARALKITTLPAVVAAKVQPATGALMIETPPEVPDVVVHPREQAEPPRGMMIGDDGPAVLDLQKTLTDRGYLLGAPDSIFGKATRAAVMAFQADNAIKSSGVVDEVTLRTLHDDKDAAKRVPDERAEMTADDLRRHGSEAVKAADQLGLISKVTGSVAGFSGIVSVASSVVSSAGQVRDTATQFVDVGGWFLSHWYVFAGLVAAFGIYRLANKLIDIRVQDARTGANMRI